MRILFLFFPYFLFGQTCDTVNFFEEANIYLLEKIIGDSLYRGADIKGDLMPCEYEQVVYYNKIETILFLRNKKWAFYSIKEGKLGNFIFDKDFRPVPIPYTNTASFVYGKSVESANFSGFWTAFVDGQRVITDGKGQIINLPETIYKGSASVGAFSADANQFLIVPFLLDDTKKTSPNYYFYNIKNQHLQHQTLDSNVVFDNNTLIHYKPINGDDDDCQIHFYNHEGKLLGKTMQTYIHGASYLNTNYQNGYLIVRKSINCGLIDSTGKEIIPAVYQDIVWVSKQYLWALTQEQDSIHIFNRANKIHEFACTNIFYTNDLMIRIGLSNLYFKKYIFQENMRWNKLLINIRNADGIWAAVDKEGKAILPFKYGEITRLTENRFAASISDKSSEKRFVLLDNQGKTIADMGLGELVEKINSNCFGLRYKKEYYLFDTMGQKISSRLFYKINYFSYDYCPQHPYLLAWTTRDSVHLINTNTKKSIALSQAADFKGIAYASDKYIWLSTPDSICIFNTQTGKLHKTLTQFVDGSMFELLDINGNQQLKYYSLHQQLYFPERDLVLGDFDEIIDFKVLDKRFFWVRKNNKYALVNSFGFFLTDFEYDAPGKLAGSSTLFTWAKKSDSLDYCLDVISGKVLWQGKVTKFLFMEHDSIFLVGTSEQKHFFIYLKSGNYTEYPQVVSFDRHLLIDFDGYFKDVEIMPYTWYKPYGLCFVVCNADKKYGLADERGNIVIPLEYEYMYIIHRPLVAAADNIYCAQNDGNTYLFYENKPAFLVEEFTTLKTFETHHNRLIPNTFLIGEWLIKEKSATDNPENNCELLHQKNKIKVAAYSIEVHSIDVIIVGNKKDEFGLLNANGWQKSIKYSYESVLDTKKRKAPYEFGTDANSGFIVSKNNLLGWVNADYTLKIPVIYNKLEWLQGDTFLALLNKQFLLINADNEQIKSFEKNISVESLFNVPYLAYYKKPLYKGLVDFSGNFRGQALYSDILPLSEWQKEKNLFRVYFGGTENSDSLGILDQDGVLICSMLREGLEDWDLLLMLKKKYKNKIFPLYFVPKYAALFKRFGADWRSQVQGTINTQKEAWESDIQVLSQPYISFYTTVPIYFFENGDWSNKVKGY